MNNEASMLFHGHLECRCDRKQILERAMSLQPYDRPVMSVPRREMCMQGLNAPHYERLRKAEQAPFLLAASLRRTMCTAFSELRELLTAT
jgi:hypothetical protein